MEEEKEEETTEEEKDDKVSYTSFASFLPTLHTTC